jgi:hypothetical protein
MRAAGGPRLNGRGITHRRWVQAGCTPPPASPGVGGGGGGGGSQRDSRLSYFTYIFPSYIIFVLFPLCVFLYLFALSLFLILFLPFRTLITWSGHRPIQCMCADSLPSHGTTPHSVRPATTVMTCKGCGHPKYFPSCPAPP